MHVYACMYMYAIHLGDVNSPRHARCDIGDEGTADDDDGGISLPWIDIR